MTSLSAVGPGHVYVKPTDMHDRVIVWIQNNELDVDDVVEYLRGAYKEYQRKPMGPFQAMVARAVACVQDQGGVAKPELKLQV